MHHVWLQVTTLRIFGIVLSFVPALPALPAVPFLRRHALPGRLALRWLWYCIRLEIILGGVWSSPSREA